MRKKEPEHHGPAVGGWSLKGGVAHPSLGWETALLSLWLVGPKSLLKAPAELENLSPSTDWWRPWASYHSFSVPLLDTVAWCFLSYPRL